MKAREQEAQFGAIYRTKYRIFNRYCLTQSTEPYYLFASRCLDQTMSQKLLANECLSESDNLCE